MKTNAIMVKNQSQKTIEEEVVDVGDIKHLLPKEGWEYTQQFIKKSKSEGTVFFDISITIRTTGRVCEVTQKDRNIAYTDE